MTSRSKAAAALLAVPLLIVLGAVLIWPLLTLGLASLTDGSGHFTLSNYVGALTSSRYQKAMLVTAVLALLSTVLALILCVPAGLYIGTQDTALTRGMAVALSIPLSLPGIVVGFFIILLVGNTGVVPLAFESAIGQRHLQIAYTWAGLTLGYLYFQIPRIVLVVRGAAAAVRPETVQAAQSLGEGTVGVYRRVVIPALRPAIASASGLAFATAFGAYGTAATLARGQRVMPLEIAAAFTENFRPELAATLSIILAVVTTTVLIGVNAWGSKRIVSVRT